MRDPAATIVGLAVCAGLAYLVVALIRNVRTAEPGTDIRGVANFWQFNPPPGWPPVPVDFIPEPGWRPDPALPAAPRGWRWWIPAPTGLGVPTKVAAAAWVPAYADHWTSQ